MKKLMIAAFAAVLSIAANAATYNWNATADYIATDYAQVDDGEGYILAGLMSYIFDANAVTKTAILASLAGGDLTALDSAMKSFEMAEYGQVDVAGANSLSEVGGTGSAFMVVLDSATAATATSFWASDDVSGAIDATVQAGGYAALSFGEVEANTGSWTKIENVPEPTSGLLLLLGMAGLALKRKNA